MEMADASVHAGYDLRLVLDNWATHRAEPMKSWLLRSCVHPASPPG
ncbi:hypothetical protein [Pseudofrankia sp. BMG5.36]|nr:hypothetical protein [Pseudofrankia sp. BMG5.36]